MIRSGAWLGATLLGVAAIVLVGIVASAQRGDAGRIAVGVRAGGVDLSNLGKGDAVVRLNAAADAAVKQPVTARFAGGRWGVTPAELGVRFDVPATVAAAYAVGRDDNPVARLGTLFSRSVASSGVSMRYQLDDAKLRAFVAKLSSIIDQPVQDAGVDIANGQLEVRNAKDGRRLDAVDAATQIKDRLAGLSTEPVDLKVAVTPAAVGDAAVADAAAQASRWLDTDVTLRSSAGDARLTKAQIAGMIRFVLAPGGDRVQASIDPAAVQALLASLDEKLGKPARNAEYALQGTTVVLARPGQAGRQLDKGAAAQAVFQAIQGGKGAVDVPVQELRPDLLDLGDAAPAQQQVAKMTSAPLTIRAAEKTYTLAPPDISSWLTLGTAQQDGHTKLQAALKPDAVQRFLQKVADATNSDPRDARLGRQGGAITVIEQAQEGRRLDQVASTTLIFGALQGDQRTVQLVYTTTPPSVTTDRVGQMGLTDLVAQGTSNFAGSPPERITNIKRGAQLIDGVLIPPGAVFSFDDTIGEISTRTGFVTGLVILDHETKDGVGGGICQVSTTLFRAAFYAGVPIVERHDHSYAVPYYTQGGYPEGFDATIYSPTLDLKFKNDTPGALLIQASVDVPSSTMTVSLYGTKMNRTVTLIDGPIMNRKPHPAPLYRPDPSLPKGTVRQIDWEHDGFDTWVARSIAVNGKEVSRDVFKSRAEPWQAIYLVGTGGVPVPPAGRKPAAGATPVPSATPQAKAGASTTRGPEGAPSPEATASPAATAKAAETALPLGSPAKKR